MCACIRCDNSKKTYQVRLSGSDDYVDCPVGTTINPSAVTGGGGGGVFVPGSGAIECPLFVDVCGGIGTYTIPTTTTTTAPTGGNGQWQALSGDPSNYVAFDCDSNGTRWRQHNRCTGASPAASPTRCYGDHVSAPTGPGASEAANSTAAEGYEPCAVSRCAGWSCSGGGLLVQRYTPEAPQPPMARNTLATLDPCYCAAARAADGRPDTAAGAVAGRGRLTVAPGGSGYRADHPTCAAAGLRCADASHNLRLRLENCYCCPHRDEPQFFSTILPCVAPIRG